MTRLTQGIPLPSDNISGNTEKIKAFYAGNLAHGWVLPKSLSSNGKRAATSSKVSEEIRRGYPRNRCPNAGFIPEERPARFGEYTNLRPETILGPTIMGGQSRTLSYPLTEDCRSFSHWQAALLSGLQKIRRRSGRRSACLIALR